MNFEFLRDNWPELADFGGYAEEYAYSDPQSALIKLRSYSESIVVWIYRTLKLPCLPRSTFNEQLKGEDFIALSSPAILDKFHLVKNLGNKAAHENKGTDKDAVFATKQAYHLGAWLYCSYHNVNADSIPAYKEIKSDHSPAGRFKKKLEQSDALYKQAMSELEQQRKAYEELLEQANQATAIKDNLVVEKFTNFSANATQSLHFNEAETRKYLIDAELREVGWDVSMDGTSTEQVGQEVPVNDQPTETGTGFVDYVLWDDDSLPLAVIEAKRFSIDARDGKKQAKDYADALEKEHGLRPVIFYTNGHDIWIWDDVQKHPARKLYGFYSKKSLQYLVKFQRAEKKPLTSIKIDKNITDRRYQIEAITRVHEKFEGYRRKALVVLATGTGKTRVSISLTKTLQEAKWVKRVLFLCDRKELRKQANNAFSEFIASTPFVLGKTPKKKMKDARIIIATYPGMMGVYENFDVGYFDLIIADESHRSIYNIYGNIFKYFDCLQVGLTATPVEMVSRSTCSLFDCDYKKPTANYPLEKAIEEEHLVPFEVVAMTTKFLREGINSKSLNDEQIAELEDQGIDPNELNFEAKEIDQAVLNKPTNQAILRNLMDNGIKDKDNQLIGKTIIFARRIEHARILKELFDEMYPELSDGFCEVIHSKEPRAEALIDQFKGIEGEPDKDITLAISVDMLDTGIDVPEVVNLVFAKPVKSKVKFWQMIGRGTRLCENLFGPGKDKSKFLIFDHWGNFDYFDLDYEETEQHPDKSIAQQRFELRLQLTRTALSKLEMPAFNAIIELVQEDMTSLDKRNINVRDNWNILEQLSYKKQLINFSKETQSLLESEIAPLMQWLDIRKQGKAFRWDMLIAETQMALLLKSSDQGQYKIKVQECLVRLPKHLTQVQAKATEIKQLMDDTWWQTIDFAALEQARISLREIMYLLEGEILPPKPETPVLDIQEDEGEYQIDRRATKIHSIDYKIFQQHVQEVFEPFFETNSVLKKIRNGEPVSEDEISQLNGIIHARYAELDIETLKEFYPETSIPLDKLLRAIVGMDADYVEQQFTELLQNYRLTAQAQRFIDMLIPYIAKNGGVKMTDLDIAPYKRIYEGVLGQSEDDVFGLLKKLEIPQPQQIIKD